MDFACGTGLVGENLSKYGKFNVEGMDISPNMLEIASNKGVYTQLHEHTLNDPENFPMEFKNKFDFVTAAGVVNGNHMEFNLFEEMLMSLKKGGIAVFAARYSFMGYFWYEKVIKDMQTDGRWELLETEEFFKYDNLVEQSVGRFYKSPVRLFVFRKTQEELHSY